MDENIVKVLDEAMANHPEKLMLVDTVKTEEIRRYTYKEVYVRAKEIADYFYNELDLTNENVLLMLPDNSEMVIYIWGCAYSANKFIVGTDIISEGDRSAQLLASKIMTANITGIVMDKEFSDSFVDKVYEYLDEREIMWIQTEKVKGNSENAPSDLELKDDISFIQFTSGTSSQPKGVLLSQKNFRHGIERMRERCVIREDNVLVSSLPLSHNLGLITTFSMFIMESAVVFMDVKELLVNPYGWLTLVTKYKASILGGINGFFLLSLNAVPDDKLDTLDLSHVHTTFVGGEEIKTNALKLFAQKFAKAGFNEKSFFPGYGMTENTLLISTSQPGYGIESLWVNENELRNNNVVFSDQANKEIASNGFIFEDDDIAIVDPNTLERLTGDAVVGEIWIAGPAVAMGYVNNEEAEKERFHWKLEGCDQEYLRSGDIGFLKDGRLYLTGRINDLIIIDGNNFYAHEFDVFIGTQVQNTPMGDIASFSKNDEDGNERLAIALGYANDKYPDKHLACKIADDIKKALQRDYKVPVSEVIFTDKEQILKTSIGKIRRNVIKNNLGNNNLKVHYIWKDGMIYESNKKRN